MIPTTSARMKSDYLIGLDVGTSSVKGVLLSTDGTLVASARRKFKYLTPHPNHVESRPEDHYESFCKVVRELAGAVPDGGRVGAISMAAASGNTLMLDAENRPLTNIVSWLDTRYREDPGAILEKLGMQDLYATVGWPWGGTFPLAHLLWFKGNEPKAFEQAGMYAMSNDYLYFRLTGKWGIDPSTATTSYLQIQAEQTWNSALLEKIGIPEEKLSKIRPSGSVLGNLTAEAAEETGLSTDAVAVLGAFDHPCAARGAGVLDPGEMLLSCGSSWVGFYPIPGRSLGVAQKLLLDPFLSPTGPWAVMHSIPKVGVAIERYMDSLGGGGGGSNPVMLFDKNAAKVGPGAGGLFLSPQKDIDELLNQGVGSQNTDGEIARAIMEGVAFEVRKFITHLRSSSIGCDSIVMVGGPSESPIWPSILAAVTGYEVTTGGGQTAGATGAAVLAGIGLNAFADARDARRLLRRPSRRVVPDKNDVDVYDILYERYLASQARSYKR